MMVVVLCDTIVFFFLCRFSVYIVLVMGGR